VKSKKKKGLEVGGGSGGRGREGVLQDARIWLMEFRQPTSLVTRRAETAVLEMPQSKSKRLYSRPGMERGAGGEK
jgi:hypothetical protein